MISSAFLMFSKYSRNDFESGLFGTLDLNFAQVEMFLSCRCLLFKLTLPFGVRLGLRGQPRYGWGKKWSQNSTISEKCFNNLSGNIVITKLINEHPKNGFRMWNIFKSIFDHFLAISGQFWKTPAFDFPPKSSEHFVGIRIIREHCR